MPSRSDLVDAILELQARAAVERATRGPDVWLDLDLSMAQVKAVFVLRHRGPLRVRALGDLLGLSPNATTALLDRLEAAGLACRGADADDRRAVLVALEPAGEALIEHLLAAKGDAMRHALDAMTVTDLEALHHGLAALLTALAAEVTTA
jgi:DNA-binding MarR family transcriptional regulator